jgi:hypothetical protein
MVTDFLVARPSFLSGVCRILDLGATFNVYNSSRTPDEADLRAVYADWKVVGDDIFRALDGYAEQHPDQAQLVSECHDERARQTLQATR